MTYLRTIVIESVALLGSMGTLLCCALPAALVSIGAGAVMAGLIANVPQLVWLSEHKIPLFLFAALMLAISGTTTYAYRRAPCPVDPVKAKSCKRMRRWSAALFSVSMLLYLIGFYFAFVASRIS